MKQLFAAVLITAASVCAAAAADLPFLASPPPPPDDGAVQPIEQAIDWSGFYGGLNIGYDWGRFSLPHGSGGGTNGVIGGGQVGANLQWGSVVGGIEADIQGTDIQARNRRFGGTYALRSYIQPLGTVRGRVGLAYDRILIYATGGLAYGDFEEKLRIGGQHDVDHAWRAGWTAGGGLEYALDPNWSIKAEYLYADLGTDRFRFNIGGAGVRQLVSYDQHLARVGLNYKF